MLDQGWRSPCRLLTTCNESAKFRRHDLVRCARDVVRQKMITIYNGISSQRRRITSVFIIEIRDLM